MKDKLIEKFKELGIENAESVVEETSKIVALHYVPKSTFNDTNTKLKSEVSLRETAEAERDDYKNQLDSANSKSSELDKIVKRNEELTKQVNLMEARRIFEKANISEDKIEELLPKVVSNNKEATLELSNSIAEMLKSSKEQTKKEVESDLLQNTAKPDIKEQGNAAKKITKEDFNKMTYSERKQLFLENKDLFLELSE